MLTSILICLAVLFSWVAAPGAQTVDLIGEFYGRNTDGDGQASGVTITLWHNSGGYIGTFGYFPEDAGSVQCGMLLNVNVDGTTGDLRFKLQLTLEQYERITEASVEALHTIEFLGTMTDSVVSGTMWESDLTAMGQPAFAPREVSLFHREQTAFDAPQYNDYGSWLAAAENQIKHCSQWATDVQPDWVAPVSDPHRFSVGVTGGIAIARGEGSELWDSGGTIGVDAIYSPWQHFSVGGRLALNRWTLDALSVANALLPEGATLAGVSTDGNGEIIDLGLLVRLTSGRLLGERWKGFVQLGGGIYFIRFQASANIGYNFDGTMNPTESRLIAVDESVIRGGLNTGFGISFEMSPDWVIEAYPLYSFVFEPEGATEYLSLSLALRLMLY